MDEHRKDVNESIINDIDKTIRNIKYGSITITVHNARIVQVEVTEKKRYDDRWLVEKGGGI
ncbi:MAG: YezD family protein [Candidatus Omnitrophota bacterium]